MTLTEAAFWTKRFGVIVIGFLGVSIIVLFIALNPFKQDAPPPEYVTPNCACTEKKEDFLANRLETIPSLELLTESTTVYEVQTDTGKLDNDLPDIVNVYAYTNLDQVLDSQANAKILAKMMGFVPEQIIRRGTSEYIWYDSTTQKSLTINARDQNFTYSTDVSKIREIRKTQDLPTEQEAISFARNALRSLSLLPDEYTNDLIGTYKIDINPDGSYSQADSLLNAELIRVDFRRRVPMISIRSDLQGAEGMVSALERRGLKSEKGTTIVNDKRVEVFNFSTLLTYQNPVKSNISVYIGPEDKDLEVLKQIYQIDYKVWDLEPTICGTYPLIAPSIAKDKIENGEGSLVFLNYAGDEVKSYSPQNVKRFLVTSVNITYYEGLLEQKFLQPVYLFSGQAELENGEWADFHIYYPAINYDIVTDKVELEEAPIEENNNFLSP